MSFRLTSADEARQLVKQAAFTAEEVMNQISERCSKGEYILYLPKKRWNRGLTELLTSLGYEVGSTATENIYISWIK